VAADLPCDAPEVWCDLAALVDANYKRVADVIGRIDPARPAVGLTMTTPTVFPTTPSFQNVPFDGAVFDTDGLYQPGRSIYRVFPSRPGVWFFDAWIFVSSNGTFNNPFSVYIATEAFGPAAVPGGSSGTSFSEDDNAAGSAPQYLRTSATAHLTAATLATTSGVGLGFSPTTTETWTIAEARFAAYWLREEP
jgi:hypothetical protein